MFKSILASITMFSIVFLSIGQIAFALPQADLADKNAGKTESCATCSTAAATNPLDRLATLGRRTQNIGLLPVARSQAKGSPIEYVASSSGELAFAQTDLAFKDNPLMLFQRTYLSTRTEDVGLGRGWSFAFNDSIALDDETAVLTNSAGDKFTYRRSAAKNYVLQSSDSTDVKEFNVENGSTISAKNGDVTRIYKRTSDGDYYLSQISAPGGFEITINRNSNGRLRGISGIGGEINLDWSSGSNAKLLAVSDNIGRRVSFGQSNGSLQNATTATGGKWQYEYAGGKINNIIDPANRIALRAKFDPSGRAVEVGDAAGLNRLAYEINRNNVSTRTTFTDSLGYARTFQHNERGILTGVGDAAGTLLSVQYNEADQPVRLTDASGTATTFEYDAQKRLKRQTAADGNEKVFEYAADGRLKATIENGERTEIVRDDDGNLAESRGRSNGKNVRTTFNRRGQMIRQEVENGLALNSEYDEKGREKAYIYSDIGRYEKTFDSAGRKTSEKMPSGFTHNYDYNADNQIIRQSDNRGHSARVERDASGNITKFVNQNTEVQVIRDEAGRIVQLTNSRGQSRRYVYNSRGALTRFIGADGRDLQFQYSERGEMQSIFNAETDALIYQRKGRGNLAEVQQRKVSPKNIWQIQKINYTSAFTNAAVVSSCEFGDGFYSGDGSWDFWGADAMFGGSSNGDAMSAIDTSGCYDPFANMFGGGFAGTCEQCRARNKSACDDDADSNLARVFAIGAGILLGCAWTGPGELVCGGLAILLGIVGGVEVASAHSACYKRVDNNCPMCK